MTEVQTRVYDDYEYARGCRVERMVIENHYFKIPVAITRSAIRFNGVTFSLPRLAAQMKAARKPDLSALCGLLCIGIEWGDTLRDGAPEQVVYIHTKVQKVLRSLGVDSNLKGKLLYHTLVGWTQELQAAIKMGDDRDGPDLGSEGHDSDPDISVIGLDGMPDGLKAALIKALLASKKKKGDDTRH